jgi:hypothetical protein
MKDQAKHKKPATKYFPIFLILLIPVIAYFTLFMQKGQKEEIEPDKKDSVPGWFTELPVEENCIFASGLGISSNEEIAKKKSELEAKANLSKQINLETTSTRQKTSDGKTETISTTKTSGILKNVKTNEQKTIKKEGRFYTYTLVSVVKE